MSLLPLREHPRRWLPEDFDATDRAAVEARFDELAARPLPDASTLEGWLRDRSELEAAVLEQRDRLHVDASLAADDEEVGERYTSFVATHGPVLMRRGHSLDERLVAAPAVGGLDTTVHGEHLRAVRRSLDLFCEANVDLLVEDHRRSKEYDAIVSRMGVELDGEVITLPAAMARMESPDRAEREAAFRGITAQFVAGAPALEQVYEDLVQLRARIASNAGCANYRDYAFLSRGRVDYDADDCHRFHDAVEECVLPVQRRIQASRREALGVETLRPWDRPADPDGPEPLRPFEGADELVGKARQVLDSVDPELGELFGVLSREGLLDVMSRPGKASGGYTCTFPERRLPFVFMNAAGTQGDVETLLHEGGHALHALLCRDHDLLFNRHAPLEFAEVASMSMELLGNEHLSAFYDEESCRRARRRHLEGVVGLLPWVMTIDRFQHDVHVHPEHGIDERRAVWRAVFHRFVGDEDVSGLADYVDTRWLRQRHVYGVPFYYIEYAIAQLGALQVWRAHRRDPAEALRSYRAALALGHSRSLPELFEAAGARLDFGSAMLGELMDLVQEELAALGA